MLETTGVAAIEKAVQYLASLQVKTVETPKAYMVVAAAVDLLGGIALAPMGKHFEEDPWEQQEV